MEIILTCLTLAPGAQNWNISVSKYLVNGGQQKTIGLRNVVNKARKGRSILQAKEEDNLRKLEQERRRLELENEEIKRQVEELKRQEQLMEQAKDGI